jgi:hypothetical protein
MKRILFLILLGALATPAFSQCTFETKTKVRKDQYSRSSQKDIKQSESAMDKQEAEFQKPKYAAIVKPTKEMKKQQKKEEQAQL